MWGIQQRTKWHLGVQEIDTPMGEWHTEWSCMTAQCQSVVMSSHIMISPIVPWDFVPYDANLSHIHVTSYKKRQTIEVWYWMWRWFQYFVFSIHHFFSRKRVHQDDQSFYMASQSTPKFKTENHQAFIGFNPASDHLLSQNIMAKWKDSKGKPIF